MSVRVTGKFSAVHCNPGHTRKFGDDCANHDGGEDPPPPEGGTRPIPLGVSIGPAELIDVNGQEFCLSGTYGAPLLIAGVTYLLSNAHVLAREGSVPATPVNADPNGNMGDNILQPGPADTECLFDLANDTVAMLSAFVAFTNGDNEVDAAIALSSPADISDTTPADGYGRIKSAVAGCTGPVGAECSNLLGLAVQKYGRTTALTKGTIVAIDFNLSVGYDTGSVSFVDQIIVEGNKGGFLRSGDSGSSLVADPNANPVGLLFASARGGKIAVANRIETVLAVWGATVSGE